MNRRTFIGAAVASAGVASAAEGAVAPREFISSDTARLRKVLVHTPGDETQKVLPLGGGDHPMLGLEPLAAEAVKQHRGLTGHLRAAGAEVLELRTLLDEAILRARFDGKFRSWLNASNPRLAEHAPRLDANSLLGGDDRWVYPAGAADAPFRPITDPMKLMLFARDLATITPRGVVLSHFVNRNRAFESRLTRFVFDWCTELKAYPIIFDGPAESAYLQGGDLIVLDEETLLLGVGNLTEETSAAKLARKLDMDVIAVQLPSADSFTRGWRYEEWNGLRVQLLHLDSVFNLLGPKSALSVPYLFEAEFAGSDPLSEILRGLLNRPMVQRGYISRMIETLATVGLVRRYRAGTGEHDDDLDGQKLVDYLSAEGFQITYVGGDPPATGGARMKHMVESVLPEVRFQGGNVVATAPNQIIACAECRHTLDALRKSGVQVTTFDSRELTRWHGGPHCLTLPLDRG